MNKLAFLLVLVCAFAQTPQPPLWPNIFWQPFQETRIDSSGNQHKNSGNYYYNYTALAYRIDRSSGEYDPFCAGGSGPYANQSTPCNQYVSKGNRYLHFPEKNYCCYCCNSTSGCGVLKPTWMSDAQYIDTEIHEGQQCYKWLKVGNQQNFLYETSGSVPLNRVTVSIYEEPSNFFNFGHRNLNFESSLLNLPGNCNVNTPCNWGVCQQIRG